MKRYFVPVALGVLLLASCDDHSNVVPLTECLAPIPIGIIPVDTTVQANDTLRLKAIVSTSPCWASLELDKGVRWVSHDTTVAVIDSVTGLLTARTIGKVRIGAHAITSPVEYGQANVTVTP